MCPPLLGCIAEEGMQNMRSGLRDMVRAAAGGVPTAGVGATVLRNRRGVMFMPQNVTVG